MRFLLTLVALVAVATGCATSPAGGAAPGKGSSTPNPPADQLVVEIHPGGGSPPVTYRLSCGPPMSGNHPAGAAACAHLNAMAHPFAPLPTGQMCSQIYSGPQTAHVTGRWKGAAVDLRLSRVDGCRTGQWNSLGPLLPGPAGVSPPG